jgi:hypothetical protein
LTCDSNFVMVDFSIMPIFVAFLAFLTIFPQLVNSLNRLSPFFNS